MSDLVTARRYARALLNVASDEGVLEAIDDDILVVRDAFHKSRDLRGVFQSPIISKEKKQAIAERLFADRLHPLLVRFTKLLIVEGREALYPGVIEMYQALRDEQLGIVPASVTVAATLGDGEKKALKRALEAMTNKQVRLSVLLDPSLIGGAVVRVRDTVYDGSVRRQLISLRERLARQRVSVN